ncbi:hypothetical protein P7H17_16705 [Paenibacillus larvae]|nr:hypothetical protein [Paenibacillus larvae]
MEENIPKAAADGVIKTLIALEIVETVEEAIKAVKLSKISENMVAAAIADTQADVLAVTQNVERKVRSAIKKAYADSVRENMAAGINGRRTISRDALDRMRQELGKSLDSGIIDAAGRRWRPDTYVEMLTRTKMMNTYREATTISALERDVQYAIISRHGATDSCSNWEGKSLSSRLRHPVPIRRMISFGQPKRYFIRIASTLLRLSEALGGTKTEKMIPTSHKRSSFRMPYGTALNFRKLRTTRC